ncbi:MAG TPA: hypothetical protein VFN87_18620 [Solirubrobacteraceae bacterium]|nr:hypothetical protein [Solirubrobacteraceae bacterium]
MAVALAALVALLGAPRAPAAPRAIPATTTPLLVGVNAVHRPGHDEVVFRFTGGIPSRRTVRYVTQLIADPSGRRVPIAGRAILNVSFFRAAAHTAAGRVTAPGRAAFALPNVMSVVRAGDFESVVSYGIGLAKRTPFHVSVLSRPHRVVVDVSASFATVLRRVYLFSPRRFAANRQPFVTAVSRPVLPGTPATGLMDRLFAGPTAGEKAAGLALLSSRATGFSDLSVRDQVARVRLTGGCSSGGSTSSIAQEIMPTLKQLARVRYVKIYDPAGHTEHPAGRSDSIPFCLEP